MFSWRNKKIYIYQILLLIWSYDYYSVFVCVHADACVRTYVLSDSDCNKMKIWKYVTNDAEYGWLPSVTVFIYLFIYLFIYTMFEEGDTISFNS